MRFQFVERNVSGCQAAINQGLCCINQQSASFPKRQGELRHVIGYGHGLAQPGAPVEDSGTDLQFGDLAGKVKQHDSFTKSIEATHLGRQCGRRGCHRLLNIISSDGCTASPIVCTI